MFDENSVRVGNCEYHHVIVAEGAKLSESSQLKASGLSYPASSSKTTVPDLHFRQEKFAISWTLAGGQNNHLVLEAYPARDAGKWRAQFRCEILPVQLQLCFADDIEVVEVNGLPRPTEQTAESGTTVILNPALLKETNEVIFQAAVTDPFVWLEGCFSVRSESPFSTGPNHTIQTNGPFVLGPSNGDIVIDEPLELISNGYPFARGPLLLEGLLVCPTAIEDSFLQLQDIAADAARIWIDDNKAAFAYGPEWQVELPRKLHAGLHRIRLGLIPSGYNFYGRIIILMEIVTLFLQLNSAERKISLTARMRQNLPLAAHGTSSRSARPYSLSLVSLPSANSSSHVQTTTLLILLGGLALP